MSADHTRSSDLILGQARQSLIRQRAGGRRTGSLGRRAAAIKRRHALRKAVRAAAALGAVLFAATLAGLVLDGIGWTGIIVTLLAMATALVLFASFPRFKVPRLADLGGGSLRSLVGRTELWLESQRPALPPPAVQLVERIGLQLDDLGLQLDGLDENLPAAREVRKLVGEALPGLVSTYTRIPRHLRGETGGARSPDQQLTDSLGRISAEIDSVTRQLASGAIDNLAIQSRFLDYKYGDALDEGGANQR